MSGVRKGGNHAMQDVSTHPSSGSATSQLARIDVESMSYHEMRSLAAELELDVGPHPKKVELIAALTEASGGGG